MPGSWWKRWRGPVRAVAVICVAATALVGCGSGSAGPGLRTMRFGGTFSPVAMQMLDGQLWLVGTTPQGCAAERVDPSTLHTKMFELPACNTYVTAGDHHLYVLGIDESAGNPADQIHVVSFDPSTGRSDVWPQSLGHTVGSGIAHMAFSFGLGDLWAYTPDQGVLTHTSSAFAAVQTAASGLQSGGAMPVMTFTDHDLWFAEGPGGSRLYELAAGASKAKVVYTAPDPGSVLWITTVDGQVWAAVATYSNNGKSVRTHLVSFAESGKATLTTGSLTVGDSAVAGPDGAMWSVGPGANCNNPEKLWRTDSDGRTRAVETLDWPEQGCLAESQIQASGPYVFVLAATGSRAPAGVLYRISP